MKRWLAVACLCWTLALLPFATWGEGSTSSALPEEPTPLATLPERPAPLLEWGPDYFAPGRIGQGFTLPTGAVWQPQWVAWGTLRTALQGEWGDGRDSAEWANRLELYGQLSLTPTERLVVSLEPLHEGTDASGYRFGLDGARAGFNGEFDADVETLYFEGDFGELFPSLDRADRWPLDLGFMVGRVPVVYQDGFLIDDNMTAFGLVQNSIQWRNTSNVRWSVIAAWDDVHRGGNNAAGGHTKLVGSFLEFDREQTTWAIDAAYVSGDERADGVFLGVSGIRRVRNRLNLTARLLASYSLDAETDEVSDGVLGILGLSLTPERTHDVAYLNLFATTGRFTPAARGPTRGGPLGRVGILFEAPGLGAVGAPLANDADHALGGALGYQKFWAGGRTQFIAEVGGRVDPRGAGSDGWGLGFRFQQALGRRTVLRFDLYGVSARDRGEFVGFRSELEFRF